MSKRVWRVLPAIWLACVPSVFAGSADSAGGIKVKSDDDRFEAMLGGRLQYDYATFDKNPSASPVPAASISTGSGFSEGPYFRRAYLTLSGKALDLKYKFEYDFASLGKTSTCTATPCTTSSAGAAKDLWLGLDALWGFVKVGHMQPAYGMEELTSSNDLLFTERPYLSNNLVYKGREFQNGISYDTHVLSGLTAMVAVYQANTSNDADASATSQSANGHGFSGRVTYAPLMSDSLVVHVGASYDDVEWKAGPGSSAPEVSGFEVARNSPSLILLPKTAYDGQKTPAFELAAQAGPFFAQAEYAKARYALNAGADQSIESYYAQASVFLTGESKPYRADKGVFGNPKPGAAEWGAIELKARHDTAKNDDLATKPRLNMTSVGVNYYYSANARLMADYNMGEAETTAGKDKPRAVVLRAQIAF